MNDQFQIFLDTVSDTVDIVVRIGSEFSLECLKGKLTRKQTSTKKII